MKENYIIVSNQLSQGKKWLENAKKFVEECNKANKNKFNFLYLNNIDTIDSEMLTNYRNENIKIIEKYIKENKIFYKDLKNLTENTPPYFKNSTESTELIKYQFLAELKMNNPIKTNNTEDILKFVEDLFLFSSWVLLFGTNSNKAICSAIDLYANIFCCSFSLSSLSEYIFLLFY